MSIIVLNLSASCDKLMASVAALEKAGKKAGLEVWRIENLEMVPVPQNLLGQFFTGDSYIVLHTKSVRGKSNSCPMF